MWQWIKTNIFTPVANFFSGITTSIWNSFTNNPEYQAIPDLPPTEIPEIPESTESLLFKAIPGEILENHLLPHLPLIKDLTNLTRSSKHFRDFAGTFFHGHILFHKAVHCIIVDLNLYKLGIILDSLNPKLLQTFLQKKVEITKDESGRTIRNSTLLQLAYGAGDHESCLELEKHFIRAFGSEQAARTEICKQLDEKFPQDPEAKKRQAAYDERVIRSLEQLLVPVVQAISNERFKNGRDENKKLLSPATLQAIETFRAGFDALLPKTIDRGMHYHSQLIKGILNIYNNLNSQWNENQCFLFEDAVVAKVLEHSPAIYIAQFGNGIHNAVREKRLYRDLFTRRGDFQVYSLLRSASDDFALSGYCFDIREGKARYKLMRGGVYGGREWISLTASDFRKLCLSMNNALDEFAQRMHQPPEPPGTTAAPKKAKRACCTCTIS